MACIEDPAVIEKILAHMKEKAAPEPVGLLPEGRAPPPVWLTLGKPVPRLTWLRS